MVMSSPRSLARRTMGRALPCSWMRTDDARISTVWAMARLTASTASWTDGSVSGGRTMRSPGRSASSASSSAGTADAQAGSDGFHHPGPRRRADRRRRTRRRGKQLTAHLHRRQRRRSLAPPQPPQRPAGGAPLEIRRLARQRLGQALRQLAGPPALEARELAQQHAQPGLVLRAQEVDEAAPLQQPKRQIGVAKQAPPTSAGRSPPRSSAAPPARRPGRPCPPADAAAAPPAACARARRTAPRR